MDAVATAFITAVQPSLHPGQMVALRAMVRAAMEAAAEAGRLSMPAGTFVPLLRPLVVAALSFAVTMARSNAGAVHPAFASTAVDELMALPQWSTRLADARMRDVADRLRVFPAGGPRRPTQAPTKNKGRGGRGAAAKE
jgi:hypothetical protein